jgi:hypothetical protein
MSFIYLMITYGFAFYHGYIVGKNYDGNNDWRV